MSDIDLTEAVEAIARVLSGDRVERPDWSDVVLAKDGIAAALPHIQRQVREQVAREIEAEWVRRHQDHAYIRSGLSIAANIARGDS